MVLVSPFALASCNIKFSNHFDIFDYNRIERIVNGVNAMSTVLEPISADKEQKEVAAFGKAFRSHAKLVGPDGKQIPVPKAIYKILQQVIPLLASNNAVSIV